ncbi:MAG: hypothetical protein UH734_04650 [Ruminococcus sp.]|nr:hypothetical protein [Ruminococcus sp.]
MKKKYIIAENGKFCGFRFYLYLCRCRTDKWIKMKNKCLFFITLIICSVFMCSCNSTSSQTEESSKSVLSKGFYNYIKNNKKSNDSISLLKMEDTFYFKKEDKTDTLLLKIKDGNAEVKYVEKPDTEKPELFLDDVLEGRVMADVTDDSYWDFDNGKVIKGNKHYYPPNQEIYDAFADGNSRYFVNKDKLYQYKDGKYQLLMTSNDLNMKIPTYYAFFYLNDKSFYCERTDDKNIYLCKFDFATKKYKNIKICQFDNKDSDLLDYPQITSFLVNGENVYVNLENKIYQINTSNDNVDLLFETAKEKIVTINYSKDNLFIGEKNSPSLKSSSDSNCIYSLNTKTQKINKCYEKSFFEFYIYDENYIYIHNLEDNGKNSIIQLSQDGKTEKVIYAD